MAVKIADGFNNVGGLQFLNELDPPYLEDYGNVEAVYTEWHDYQERVLAANRYPVTIGLPYTTWYIPIVYRDEMPILYNFTDQVTIQTLDKQTNTYKIYNAKMLTPIVGEMNYDRDAGLWWNDVTIEFYDLEEIIIP